MFLCFIHIIMIMFHMLTQAREYVRVRLLRSSASPAIQTDLKFELFHQPSASSLISLPLSQFF